VYGKDSRLELDDPENGEVLQEAGQSVALIVTWAKLARTHSGLVLRSQLLRDALWLCPGEPFADQPVVRGDTCTGFLVAPDRLATAGHCVDDNSCPQRAFVFGFAYGETERDPTQVSEDDVYSCRRVLAREEVEDDRGDAILDYAVVELDREVQGRLPLVPSPDALSDVAWLALIGHPIGLPMKVDVGWPIQNWEPFRFLAHLDAYGGNSGSPVLDRDSGEVVGILVGGTRDWDWDTDRACWASHLCDVDGAKGCKGQVVTRASVVADVLSDL
jgi:hypothetical protein